MSGEATKHDLEKRQNEETMKEERQKRKEKRKKEGKKIILVFYHLVNHLGLRKNKTKKS